MTDHRQFSVKVYNGYGEIDPSSHFPVIILSTSLVDDIDNYHEYLQMLAGKGYVVVGMGHPYLDSRTDLAGGTVRASDAYLITLGLNQKTMVPKDAAWRAKDISCFIETINTSRPDSDIRNCGTRPLSSADFNAFKEIFSREIGVDSTSESNALLAVVGHSLGGIAAQLLVSDTSYTQGPNSPINLRELFSNPSYDSRVRAAINYDGTPILNYAQAGRIEKPFLYMASEDWWLNPKPLVGPLNLTGYNAMESRLSCRSDSHAVLLNGSTHFSPFFGNTFNPDHREFVINYTDSFLSSFLKRNKAPLNANGLSYQTYFEGGCYDPDTGVYQFDNSADSDSDGISNADEYYILGTDNTNPDMDGDAAYGGVDYMIRNDLMPHVDDFDGRKELQLLGVYSGEDKLYFLGDNYDSKLNVVSILDSDGDRLPDIVEQAIGTNPYLKDTDGDNVCDYREVRWDQTSPLNPGNFVWFSKLFIGCK